MQNKKVLSSGWHLSNISETQFLYAKKYDKTYQKQTINRPRKAKTVS